MGSGLRRRERYVWLSEALSEQGANRMIVGLSRLQAKSLEDWQQHC